MKDLHILPCGDGSHRFQMHEEARISHPFLFHVGASDKGVLEHRQRKSERSY